MNENRLEFLKDEMDLKSKEIAKLLNVSESTYSEWEHNKIPIPTKRMIELADFYKVNIDYILKLTIRRLEITKAANLNLKEIGQRLLMIRKELNYSLRELGNILNCSFSALASYENEENRNKEINHGNLIALADFYEVSIDYLFCRTENREQINTPLMELHLNDEMVALLKSGRINNRLLCEIATNDKFEQLMTDTEIYIDGHATSTFRTLYESLEEQRQTIIQKYKQAENDFYSKTILAAEVKEENFFCHVTHKTWDAILHDIRKAHEHDIDSTPDYSLAKKMALEIRKAIQSSGDYLGKVWAVIFNMLGIDFYKLPPDEQKILKRILSKSPNIKNSPFNFRRKRK